MRSRIVPPLHLLLCLTALCLISESNLSAQTFTTLHTFTAASGYPSYTNSEGAYPAGLIISGNTLYGTTGQGGSSGRGTIFRVNIDGSIAAANILVIEPILNLFAAVKGFFSVPLIWL